MMGMNANNGKLKYMGESYYHNSVMVTMKGFYIEMVKSKISLQPLIAQTIVSEGRFPRQLESLSLSRGLTSRTIIL